MHSRIAHLYSHVQLAGNKTPFKKVKDAFDKATKYIHTKGSFSSDDLAHKDVRPLIDETNNVLKTAFSKTIETEMPAAMLQKLQDDVFLFSGMKTYTQLKEASLLLTDANKNIKSWELFRNDIQKIDSTYNENYLRAEHQHAVAAVQSAAQYHEYMQDADRYNLQIRTAGDDRVRASHAALNGITRPANDAYWNTTWTPFDWGCRCRIIQVLKGKYEVTDAESANKAAASAVGELFKYNPGKEQVIFPPKHPYYPQHCNGAKLNVSGLIGFAKWLLDAEGDRCKAKSIVESFMQNQYKKYTVEEKQAIYKMPFEDQFKNIKLGELEVKAHLTFKASENDIEHLVDACRHFIQNGKTPYLMPVVHRSETEARNKLFLGDKHFPYNADLFIKEDNELWEVESCNTDNERNVRGRISEALRQADNIYFIIQNKTHMKLAEERLRARANKFILK
jgi:SPP1 gp7 family putative phage head morphogenesis protein